MRKSSLYRKAALTLAGGATFLLGGLNLASCLSIPRDAQSVFWRHASVSMGDAMGSAITNTFENNTIGDLIGMFTDLFPDDDG